METTISQRVIKLMEYLNFDPEKDKARFSREIGMDRPDNLYNLLNGDTKNSSDVLVKILNKFENINPRWLLFESGEISIDENSQIKELKNRLEGLEKKIEVYKEIIRDLSNK
jgi:hypothetical protein